jgi:hypothetical protein
VLDTHQFQADDVLSALDGFLADWRSTVPNLCCMELEAEDPPESDLWSEDLQQAVQNKVMEVGIPCTVIHRAC